MSSTTFITYAVEGDGDGRSGMPDVSMLAAHSTEAPVLTDPLSADQAASLVDEAGMVTVVVVADLASMMDAHSNSEDDEHDYLHGLAFEQGLPYDCGYRVLGVSGEELAG